MFEWPELVVIGGVALLIFGPKSLPGLARSLGQGIKEFRKASQETMQALSEPEQKASASCPSCNQPLKDVQAKFCPNCGKPSAGSPQS